VPDDLLAELLTTVFFAGLETYEGDRHAIGVAFLGGNADDFVFPQAVGQGAAPLYQWKILRFESPRPFAITEMVKLAVAGTDTRMYSAVQVIGAGGLAITGLAREGFNTGDDPFLKIVATRPGCLAVRNGRDLLLGYERGVVLTGGENIVVAAGPVRRALELIARMAGLDNETVPDYLDAVRSLVREVAAHGRGGILVVSPDQHPHVTRSAPYRMALDSSLASLLRLARRIGRKEPHGAQPRTRGTGSADAAGLSPGAPDNVAFRYLLRNAFLVETERVIQEMGALSAIDGALLLNRELALIAFGVVLPVGRPAPIAEAADHGGLRLRPIDMGSRGTRHRAAVTYAADNPGSVVFVASEDGHLSCMFRDSVQRDVILWRLGPADANGG
jgi:hypothetical protein